MFVHNADDEDDFDLIPKVEEDNSIFDFGYPTHPPPSIPPLDDTEDEESGIGTKALTCSKIKHLRASFFTYKQNPHAQKKYW